ncbi:MAG TPA: ParA family protein [Kofleriaceae bacterium]|jgi:cellulose biosynthesis protein BcsQ|nr:ParA family protein [Kofleriaceae bacterium]
MKTLALFNNKGGVGKTSLAYHLGFMFAELGHRVVFADLDPQANLSSLCLDEDRLEQLWKLKPRPTIYGAIEKLRRGIGDVERVAAEAVTGSIVLVPGDLQLSELEDDLSQQWPKCLDRDERAFRVTTSLYRVVADVGDRHGADIAVLDVGPNFGAINRAALIAADYVLVPVAPDLFSMQGLENVGPRLVKWRGEWRDRLDRAPELDFSLPAGMMASLGYVVARHSVLAGGAVKAFQRWIDRMPEVYRRSFGQPPATDLDIASDEYCLGQLKDFRSLMPMAQEAKKPMFLLKPADGAIGGHQGAVRQAYTDFRVLAERIATAMGGL